MTTLTSSRIHELAGEYGIPAVDVLCIALNLYGLGPEQLHPRIRYKFIPLDEEDAFLIITPTNVHDSPFKMAEGAIWLSGERVGSVAFAENDDVVLSYLRESGRQLTLNSNSRSTCTGCMFCPNIIEDPADTRLKTDEDLDRFVRWVMADYNWRDLAHLNKISISSGCFYVDRAAIEHLAALYEVAGRYGFKGSYHILSSIIRTREAIQECVERLHNFHLTVTYECATRRSLLLKETKSDLTLEECIGILDYATELGALADITYIAGLDPFDISCMTLLEISRHVSTFPRIQIFQAHNELMRSHRAPRAGTLEWFLELRRVVEPNLSAQGVRPRPYENYRGLWYTRFAGEPIPKPRI